RLLDGFKTWLRKDLLNHVPWLLAMGGAWAVAGRRAESYPPALRWGLLLGGLCYVLFLIVLAPWNTGSYYAGPLGVFFAFTAAVFLAPLLDHLSGRWQAVLIAGATALNMCVAQYALGREATYNQNTQALWRWIKSDGAFQLADRAKQVDCD